MLQFLIVVLLVAESVHSAKAMGLCRFARSFPCSEKCCPVSANLTESSPPKMVSTNDAKEQALCQEEPQLEGRMIVYTDNSAKQKQHLSGLTITCEDNMVRFGSKNSTCLNGAWSPPVAVCKVNHALRKPAYQESTVFNGTADRAVDGNTNSSWLGQSCTHTRGVPETRWWYVDLGSSVLVQAIVIYNRQDGDFHSRLLSAKVRVGDYTDDVSMNQLAGIVNETSINPIHIDVNPAIEGSIVSISKLTDQKALTLCEVQVFGELLD